MSLPTCPTCVYAKGICKKTGVEIRITTGCTYHTPKSVTNADRIRSMTYEELAEYLFIKTCEDGFPQFTTKNDWLDWLKEEVKDADT